MLFPSKETEKSVKNEIVLHPPNSDARCGGVGIIISSLNHSIYSQGQPIDNILPLSPQQGLSKGQSPM